jgi:hypothetical protein
MIDGVAAIGLVRVKGRPPAESWELFKSVLRAVEQFVGDHPEMLEGEGDFVVMFGPRSKIKVE